MFEGSLVESRRLVGTGTERWTTLGSLTVQCAVAGLLIAIPLLRPQILSVVAVGPPLAVPFLRKPSAPVQTRMATAASTPMSLPAAGPAPVALGPTIWPHPGEFADGPAIAIAMTPGMGTTASGLAAERGSGATEGGWAAEHLDGRLRGDAARAHSASISGDCAGGARAGHGGDRGGDLGGGAHRKRSCGERAANAAEGGVGRRCDSSVPAISAERPADRGADDVHGGLLAGKLGWGKTERLRMNTD